jgi:BirA family transcriptional regulator, biotin operon repressor / biotin---[acetyl-CoA-carboxylase] ligase
MAPMRVLTDDPALARAFVPAASPGGWHRDPNLPPHDRMLVSALGLSGAEPTGLPGVWSQDVEPGNRFWSTIALVSHSRGSQFDALDALLRRGWRSNGPTAALAIEGTGFRGQRDRTWAAARGNLHVSAAAPVGLDTEHIGAALSMLPAVAAVEAIAAATRGAVRPGIKWVNDILVAERKVGGVLAAAHTTGRRIDDVVWGVGINVEVTPAVDPTPFVPAATCLHAAPGGAQVTVPALFWALLDAIAARHSELGHAGSTPIFTTYRRHSIAIGRAVRVWEESGSAPSIEGVVEDIAPDLTLQLEGQSARVTRGRLELLPAAAAKSPVDPALVAAIAAAVSSRFPGARVTRIDGES